MKLRVVDIMETYSPVYPYYNRTWEGVKAYYEATPYEQFKVDLLVSVLESGQAFREPIALDLGELTVGNGTHRLIAAHLAGIDEIEVEYWYGDDDDNDNDNEHASSTADDDDSEAWLETVVQIRLDEDVNEQESIDDVINVLMSIPVNDDFWATSSCCMGGNVNRDRTADFMVPWDESSDLTPEEVRSLETALRTRLEAIDGVHVQVITSERVAD